MVRIEYLGGPYDGKKALFHVVNRYVYIHVPMLENSNDIKWLPSDDSPANSNQNDCLVGIYHVTERKTEDGATIVEWDGGHFQRELLKYNQRK